MHFQLIGDITQYHRFHAFITVIKEQALALDDGFANTLQRVAAALQALQEPACLLQAVTQMTGVLTSAGIFQVAFVYGIDLQLWCSLGIQAYVPVAIYLAYEDIRDDILRIVLRDAGAGFRIK